MIDRNRIAALPREQLALFTTGCAARIAPLMAAFGIMRERRIFHACIDALWASDGHRGKPQRGCGA